MARMSVNDDLKIIALNWVGPNNVVLVDRAKTGVVSSSLLRFCEQKLVYPNGGIVETKSGVNQVVMIYSGDLTEPVSSDHPRNHDIRVLHEHSKHYEIWVSLSVISGTNSTFIGAPRNPPPERDWQ